MLTRTRGHLPHIEVPDGTYFLTFRLLDSLPQSVVFDYKEELEMQQKLKVHAPLILLKEYEAKIHKYLDASYGQCWLRDPRIAQLIVEAFRKHNDDRYRLHAYTIMPNHVHILFSLSDAKDLSEIICNWKGSISFYANKVLQRSGTFWQREYFDTVIKTQRQFEFAIRYIFRNPVNAGLCEDVFQWPWTAPLQTSNT
jgi:REP element-mobilizing transposase RayT